MALYEPQFAAQTSSALYQPLFATGTQTPEAGSSFGIFGNALREGRDIVTGLGGLLGAGLHDIGVAGAKYLIPGEQSIERGGFTLDDIARNLPGAMAQDYITRFGPLLQGDIGGFLGQVAERPLSFGLDVLGAGKAVGIGAQLAARGGRVAEGSGLAKLLPQPTARIVGNEILTGYTSGNPVVRTLFEKPFERFATMPITELEQQAGALRALRDAGADLLPAEAGELARLEQQLNLARQAGITRIDKPFVAATRLRRMTDRIIGQHFQAGLKARDEDLALVDETLRPVAEAGISDDVAEATFQRLAIEGKPGGPFEPVAGSAVADELVLPSAPEAASPLAGVWRSGTYQGDRRALTLVDVTGARAVVRHTTRHGIPGDDAWTWRVLDAEGNLVPTLNGYTATAPEAQIAAEDALRQMTASGNMPATLSADIGTASIESSANAGSLDLTQAPSVQVSRGPIGSSSRVRSKSPLEYQYLGSEVDITRAQPPFHAYTNPQAFLDATVSAEQELRSVLEGAFGPDALIASRAKGAERLTEKLQMYADRLGGAPEQHLPRITDGVGARVQIGSWTEVPAKLDQLRGAVDVLEVDDFISNPHRTGYRGVHATVRLPSGFVGEVQFHTPLSARLASEEVGHVAYQRLRTLQADVLRRTAAGQEIPESLRREIDLTDAYVRRSNEPVLREMEEQLQGRPMSVLERTMENLRLVIQEHFTNPMIERGLLTPAEAMERSYLGLRVASGARYDYKAGGFVGGMDTLDLDRMLDAQGISAPIYFPHIDIRRTNFSDFISLSKARIGARSAARGGFTRRSTGYLIEKGLYERNPLAVYQRRAAQAVRMDETYRFVNDIAQRFGRPLASADQLNPATEALFAPDGLLRFFRMRLAFDDELSDLLAAARSEDEALADALKAVLEPIQDELGDTITRTGVGVTKRGVELYAIPKAVAERLEAHVRPLLGPAIERNVRLFWDTPTNAWRGFALAGSPRWVTNNTIGNTLFLKMQGARVRDVVAQFSRRYREMLAKVPGIEQAEGGMFSQAELYTARRGTASLSRTGQALEAAGELRPVKGLKAAAARMRQINQIIENAFRRASYLTALERAQTRGQVLSAARHFDGGLRRLERIAARGASDDVIRAGLDEVNFFFNDYTRATPFGRQIIRRFVAPFWSFYRHVLRLSVAWPVQYPLRAEVLRGMTLVTNELLDEYGPVPPWLAGAFPLGPPGASVPFLSTRGANPFTTLFQAPLSLLHPAWGIVVEQSTGRETFSGREFTAPDVVQPFGSDQQFRIVFDDQGNPVGAEPVDRVSPSLFEQLLGTIPQYELAKDLVGGGAAYSTSGLYDILTGRGVITDPATGQPLYPSSPIQQLGAFAGAPTYQYDLGAYQEELAEQQVQALREYLRRNGLG